MPEPASSDKTGTLEALKAATRHRTPAFDRISITNDIFGAGPYEFRCDENLTGLVLVWTSQSGLGPMRRRH